MVSGESNRTPRCRLPQHFCEAVNLMRSASACGWYFSFFIQISLNASSISGASRPPAPPDRPHVRKVRRTTHVSTDATVSSLPEGRRPSSRRFSQMVFQPRLLYFFKAVNAASIFDRRVKICKNVQREWRHAAHAGVQAVGPVMRPLAVEQNSTISATRVVSRRSPRVFSWPPAHHPCLSTRWLQIEVFPWRPTITTAPSYMPVDIPGDDPRDGKGGGQCRLDPDL